MQRSIYCIGDTHGLQIAYDTLRNFIIKYNIANSLFIQVGDFGIGFNPIADEDHLESINDILKRDNNELYVIRGNHDNPKYFNGEYIRDTIKLLKDYTILDDNTLLIGGAISIDRLNRVEGVSYWKDEKLIYNDMVQTFTGIEYVITHTCPSFLQSSKAANDLQFFKMMCNNIPSLYNKLINECQEERTIMTTIYDELSLNNKLKKWYYGHFHNEECVFINDTEFQCLNDCMNPLSKLTIKQLK
jgi:hypothetical protein